MNAPSNSVAEAIERVRSAPRITRALRAAELVSFAAAMSVDPASDARLLREVTRECMADGNRDGDDLTTIAAIHALGAISDPLADLALIDVLRAGPVRFTGHAAWSMAARRPSTEAMIGLIQVIITGGFNGMLAERTLIEWSRRNSASAIWLLRNALQRNAMHSGDETAALRIGNTLAAVPGSGVVIDVTPRDHLLRESAAHDDGLVVIQPFLHARLDQEGRSLGVGDGGGIASLLRSLGTSLAAIDDVSEVVTVTRAHIVDGGTEPRSGYLGTDHRIERIAFGADAIIPWRDAWQYRTLIEREMVAIGRQFEGRNVVWHLRMAEVGTLAAAAAARQLGQRVVFTVAPDPHVVIDALEADGRLRRSGFADADAASQYWFRARMVERLSSHADHLALLPRPTIRRELVDLVGLDMDDLWRRSTIVPEGVDVGEIDRATHRRSIVTMANGNAVPAAAAIILAGIPDARRGLPWILTVGRLNLLKGPHRIVESVVGSEELSSRFNVVLVGGDLEHPSREERSTMDLIAAVSTGHSPGAVSVIGHLPPTQIADLLVYASNNGGLYVCGSDKEEFGLAIVEALAAGLTVVAPLRGGPLTYVCDGYSGVLCDTTSVEALRQAILQAAVLRSEPDRSRSSRKFVRAELSVDRMAARLVDVYASLMPVKVAAA